MPFTIGFNKDKQIIMVVVSGELSLPLLKTIAGKVSHMIARTGCRLIQNDLRAAHLTKGAFDVLTMPKIANQAGVAPNIKRALIVGDRIEEFRFLETVFFNQGNSVRIFTGVEDAEEWLFENKKESTAT